MTKFDDFLFHASHVFLGSEGKQRKGQAYMNALWTFEPHTYTALTGSAFDPFYRDDRIPAFLGELMERWQEREE